MYSVEAIRAQFRPQQIKTLFVGESAPVNGDFFYRGDSNMLRYMKEAVESAVGGSGDFLSTFQKLWLVSRRSRFNARQSYEPFRA